MVRVLSTAAALLLATSVAGQLIAHLSGSAAVLGAARLVYVDAEHNLPTAFSVFLLVASAFLAALIAVPEGRRAGRTFTGWAVMAAALAAMAVDEAWSFHERLINPMRRVLGGDDLGILFYGWVVPALALVAAGLPFFVRFLSKLPGRTRRLFAVAAGLYLAGALGMELVAGWFNEAYGLHETKGETGGLHLAYSMLATLEEGLEMFGVIILIHALLTYARDRYGALTLAFAEGTRA